MAERKLFAGARLRNLRKNEKLSQRDFAKRLGISASYLNQLENNQRPLSAAVMLGLVEKFDIDLTTFAEDESLRLAADLHEALADPILAGRRPSKQETKSAISHSPAFAHALIAFHSGYQNLQNSLVSLNDILERGQIPAIPLPYEEVRDFFHYSDNYFDALDKAAEARARESGIDGINNKHAAIDRLSKKHGITVSFERDNLPKDSLSEYRADSKLLLINREHPEPSQIFLLWHQIALLEDSEEIDRLIDKAAFQSPEGRSIARIGLANFSAGATVMPYGEFLALASDFRHDLDLLAGRFGASIEQVAHRLSTLQRPGAKGVPFYFMRVDRAGAITKRHSTTRLQFARYGGACPLWNVHQAFETPGEIVRQLAETPDGERYVCIARTITKRGRGFRAPIRRYAIALGSPADFARDIVYGDDLKVNSLEAYEKIGVSCRICNRKNCPQRAVPPIDRKIEVDTNTRRIVPFRIE
ncbi:helix-turn-helix domain-containing protein [Sedimentitalea todarodis]|uniref:Short-chain fatty acyl-CoA regulator family protein n=1 Tax=Sedimentitalea todarodis TaxID=1631240 RepID=A0ABU3VE72_9RHOB|nr:short-chain fatty acyl-CoA regulator family protein [Sedimentitalea todarodis]MDU9004464.1 short-chain fatty acyl-CoA regulator family protein [Sedimentitalea todarodis]